MSETCHMCERTVSPDSTQGLCFYHEKDESAARSWECLMMVREVLEGIMGEGSMDACPPMFYPEAIMTACAKAAEVGAATGNPQPSLPLTPPDSEEDD